MQGGDVASRNDGKPKYSIAHSVVKQVSMGRGTSGLSQAPAGRGRGYKVSCVEIENETDEGGQGQNEEDDSGEDLGLAEINKISIEYSEDGIGDVIVPVNELVARDSWALVRNKLVEKLITVDFAGPKCHALVDSGCQITVISSKMLDPERMLDQEVESKIKLKGAVWNCGRCTPCKC